MALKLRTLATNQPPRKPVPPKLTALSHHIIARPKENPMKTKRYFSLIAALVLSLGSTVALEARAQSEVSALSAISAMPLASVVLGASAVAGAVVAVPMALSTAGTVLVVKAVEVSARGTVFLLERASDGAAASVEVLSKTAAGASVAAGALVSVGVIGAGIVLSVAGDVIAFIPNALGRALLYNERVTK